MEEGKKRRKIIDNYLKAWLLNNTDWSEPRIFYHFLSSSIMCDLELNHRLIKSFFRFWTEKRVTLEKVYYLAKISELSNLAIPKLNIFQRPEVIREFWYFLYLVDKGFIREKIDRGAMIEYFRACQNPDGGFRFSPNTTSFIDNNFYCSFTYFIDHTFIPFLLIFLKIGLLFSFSSL